MTKEEKIALREKMEGTVKIGVERLHRRFSDGKEMQLDDLFKYADILKDMSEIDRNVAKARFYDGERKESEEVI